MNSFGMNSFQELEKRIGIKLPVIMITNPAAGSKSKAITEQMMKKLGSCFFECHDSQSGDDIVRIVSEKSKELENNGDSKRLILVNGGDGTYNKAINSHADLSKLIFGLVPGGTSSDFATTIGMRNTERTCNLVNKLFNHQILLEDYVKPTDIISVKYDGDKEIRALNIFSLGIDGLVCKEVNASRKKGGFGRINPFLSEAIKALRTGTYKYIDAGYMIFNNDSSSGTVVHDVLSFIVINGQYAGKRMNYNPCSQIDDGNLEGIIARKMSFTDFVRLARQVKRKNSDKHVVAEKDYDGFNKFNLNYLGDIQYIEINILNVDETKEYYLNMDGEEQKMEHPTMPVRVEVLPRATNVLYISEKLPVPPDNLRIFYDKRLILPDFEL